MKLILDLRTQAHWRKGLIPLSFEWYACAYPVRRGEDGYEHIITEQGEHLFKWEKKDKVTFITDQ